MGGVAQILILDYLNPFWWLAVAILGYKLFALVDAATRPEDGYRAADKKTKGFWLAILGIAFGLDLLFGANFMTSFLTLGAWSPRSSTWSTSVRRSARSPIGAAAGATSATWGRTVPGSPTGPGGGPGDGP